jgi:hypothetical protein
MSRSRVFEEGATSKFRLGLVFGLNVGFIVWSWSRGISFRYMVWFYDIAQLGLDLGFMVFSLCQGV